MRRPARPWTSLAISCAVLVAGAGASPAAVPGPVPAAGSTAAAAASAAPPAERTAGRTVIRRDEYGVPHVYADTASGLFHGYGYAVAQDRLFQMEMAKRSVLGTSAEVVGEAGLDNDKRARESLDREAIQQQIEALPAEDRAVLAGYASGFNRHVDEVLADPGRLLPRQFTEFGVEPSRWTEYDVAMIWIGTMANRFSDFTGELDNLAVRDLLVAEHGPQEGQELFDQLVWVEDPTAPTTVPRTAPPEDSSGAAAGGAAAGRLGAASPALFGAATAAGADLGGHDWPHGAPEASNLWIVGDEKSSGDGSILMNGPQFGWFNPSYVYGVGLHGAGFDVTGNTPFAYPAVLFGTNKTISWGSTAGPLDVNDVYQEQLHPDDPGRYLYDGQYRPLQVRTERIAVKGQEPVEHAIRSTVHGPVIATDEARGTAYTKKRAWKGTEVRSLMAWVNMMKAENWEQYLEQAERMGITINWYYADKHGNIGYVSPGRLPDRPEDQDFRLPAVGDGSMEWEGYRPFADNPQVYNPEQGYIANWNNQSAPGFNSDSGNWSSVDRVDEILARLEAREEFTPRQIWDINEETSFADLNVDHLLPHLQDAVDELPADDPRAMAAQLLTEWDGLTVDRDEDGAYDGPQPALMRAWLPRLTEAVLEDDLPAAVYDKYAASVYAEPKGSVRPAESTKLIVNALNGEDAGVEQTVDLFNGADPGDVLRETFGAALQELREQHGADPAGWLTPVTPHRYATNNFMGIPQAGADEALSTHQYMNRGTENDLVVLEPHRARMCAAAPPGQSGFIAPDGTRSPHYADQLELYTGFGCKEEHLYRRQVKQHTESVTVLERPRSPHERTR